MVQMKAKAIWYCFRVQVARVKGEYGAGGKELGFVKKEGGRKRTQELAMTVKIHGDNVLVG